MITDHEAQTKLRTCPSTHKPETAGWCPFLFVVYKIGPKR